MPHADMLTCIITVSAKAYCGNIESLDDMGLQYDPEWNLYLQAWKTNKAQLSPQGD